MAFKKCSECKCEQTTYSLSDLRPALVVVQEETDGLDGILVHVRVW